LPLNKHPIVVSACLLGIRCGYDGKHALCTDLLEFTRSFLMIPVCPEQLGGLPTPRPAAWIEGGDGFDVLDGSARLINRAGRDVTDAFRNGAHAARSIARMANASVAVLKDRSPSCGLRTPHCEKPAGFGIGVTAALFQKHGINLLELKADEAFPTREFLELTSLSVASSTNQ
jgi:uncharacterized protein YbbK (DUF523 family)